jgi:hypothetical protein
MQLISQPGEINVDLLMKYRSINHGPSVLVGNKLPIGKYDKKNRR